MLNVVFVDTKFSKARSLARHPDKDGGACTEANAEHDSFISLDHMLHNRHVSALTTLSYSLLFEGKESILTSLTAFESNGNGADSPHCPSPDQVH
jgi:hypothetical protein